MMNARQYKITQKLDICNALDITEEMARYVGFSEKEMIFLRLATEEACSNAYEYIKNNNREAFYIYWATSLDRLIIEVIEQGEHFSIALSQQINNKLRGRGLQLILNIMDEVRFEFKGNQLSVVMEKRKEI